MAYTVLDKILDQYAKSIGLTVSDPTSDIDPVNMAKEKLRELVVNEVLRENHDDYTETIKQELIEEREQNQIDSIKTFITDGLLLAILVGILTNQITDIITWLKLPTDISGICIGITLFLILSLALVIFFCLYYRYLTKVSGFIRERKKKRTK